MTSRAGLVIALLAACGGAKSPKTQEAANPPTVQDAAVLPNPPMVQDAAASVSPTLGVFHGSIVLGAPSADSVRLTVLSPDQAGAVSLVYGTASGQYTSQTEKAALQAGVPLALGMTGLVANTRYLYRLIFEPATGEGAGPTVEYTFHTARVLGSRFAFGVQGDSHPERAGKMFSGDLYRVNMGNVAQRQPDFYFALGDDFSIEGLLDRNALTEANVNSVYANQHAYFGLFAHSTALFLVNGNHEQAAGYLLSPAYVTPFVDAPVLAGHARTGYFQLPAADGFYSVDDSQIPGVGLVRDYYAWQWGDALFVTVDPYWHSPVPVDTGVPGVDKEADGWKITMGEEQYAWLKKTLETSTAKYKFVFEHHVMGYGRGGVAEANAFEWGGYNKKGVYEFDRKRPGWAKPVHKLMADTRVTIFFFGHDHVFAREKLDGVVYQSVPDPADNTYTAFNADAYVPASVNYPGANYSNDFGAVLPNSGYLHVEVAPDQTTVSYVRAVLPGDVASAGANNNEISNSYQVYPQ